MKKTCLITGGAGFIGCAVSRLLESDYEQIVVYDNLHPQIHPQAVRPELLSGKAEIFRADICNPQDWDAFFRKYRPETIFHFAAETGTGQSLTESYRHTSVNVSGLGQMLDAIVRNKCFPKKILLTSSRAVYGEGEWIGPDGKPFYPAVRSKAQLDKKQWDYPGGRFIPFDCTLTQTHPSNVYGVTKVAQEQLLDVWCRSFDIDYTIVRLQNVYGPGQSLHNSYTGIITLFGRLAKAGESIPLYEDGLMLRDFVYIDDVARAIFQASNKAETNRKIYDIGSGKADTIQQAAQIIAEYYHAPVPHVCGKYRLGDVRHAACRIDRTEKELDWKPLCCLRDGLYHLCEWIEKSLC